LFGQLSSALQPPGNGAALQQVRATLQEAVDELKQAVARRLPANASTREIGERIDLEHRLETLQAADEVARCADNALRITQMLKAIGTTLHMLELQATADKAALVEVNRQLDLLRSPGLDAIERMKGLDRQTIVYKGDLGFEVGPAESYPRSLLLADGHVRVGDSGAFITSNEVNCSVATWVAVMAHRLPELERANFSPAGIQAALHQWLIAPGYERGSRGPIAVIEHFGLGREILDFQDIRKGDLLQTWGPGGLDHSCIVTDVRRDPVTGRIVDIKTISANIPDGDKAIKQDRSLASQHRFLNREPGYNMYVGRLLASSSESLLGRGLSAPQLLEEDRKLQAHADRLERRIKAVDSLKKLESDIATGLSPQEAVRRFVELVQAAQIDPAALEAAYRRIWIEAGGEGEPPPLH
jgi:hypothetical protein